MTLLTVLRHGVSSPTTNGIVMWRSSAVLRCRTRSTAGPRDPFRLSPAVSQRVDRNRVHRARSRAVRRGARRRHPARCRAHVVARGKPRDRCPRVSAGSSSATTTNASCGISVSRATHTRRCTSRCPDRNLTLILLANSDGLAAPYTSRQRRVTASLFASSSSSCFVA